MRILQKANAEYTLHSYTISDSHAKTHIDKLLGVEAQRIFKTLVTIGESKTLYVFMVPLNKELMLKKAALLVGEKSISMLHEKYLFDMTGYVHGGCSPIGMKKKLLTTVDESAKNYEKILFSAGKIGSMLEMSLAEAKKVIDFKFGDISGEAK